MAYFGGIIERLSGTEDVLKTKMLTALYRITSPHALQKIANELKSKNEDVLNATLSCLGSIPSSNGSGIFHGMFSSNPAARVAALQMVNSPYTASMALYVLGESSLRQMALDKIYRQLLSVEALPPIRNLTESGVVSRCEARNLIFCIPRSSTLMVLNSSASVNKEQQEEIKKKLLGAKNREKATLIEADKEQWNDSQMDWLFDLFWLDEKDESHPELNLQTRQEWLNELNDRVPKSAIDSRPLFLSFAR